jgi:hypothetical protein
MKKIIFVIVLMISLVIAYKYVYKSGRDIANETHLFELTTLELKNEILNNQEASLKKYLNKTILVSGKVTTISKNTFVLDNFISAQLIAENYLITKDSFLKIKGRVIGYDDLLEELKLDNCTILNK